MRKYRREATPRLTNEVDVVLPAVGSTVPQGVWTLEGCRRPSLEGWTECDQLILLCEQEKSPLKGTHCCIADRIWHVWAV